MALQGLLQGLLRRRPDLPTRSCEVGRWWDKLHYLLSANRRDEPGDETDALVDAALRGDAVIAPHVRSGQGVPVRWTAPDRVARIAAALVTRSHESLAHNYVPSRMVAAAVYKFAADGADADEWRWICEYFDRLCAFYRAAAGLGDGVLVCTD